MHRLVTSSKFLLISAACIALASACSDDSGSGAGTGGGGGSGDVDGGGSKVDAGHDAGGSTGRADGAVPDGGAGTDAATDGGTGDGGDIGDGAAADGSREGGSEIVDAQVDSGQPDTGPPQCTGDTECDDGQFCNGDETCDPSDGSADARGCVAGTPPDCDDGFDCSDDSCDEDADACVNATNDARCNDGKFCNGTETCDPTSDDKDADGCVADPVDPCDDGVTCTADACNDIDDECINTPLDVRCGNGDFCDGTETCVPDDVNADAMGCVPGTDPCIDTADCTVDSCDETNDICNNVPDDAFCDDGAFCDGPEVCDPDDSNADGEGCVQQPPPDCADAFDCTVNDRCDATLNRCVRDLDDDSCSNGSYCDGVEACAPGVAGADSKGCISGSPPNCNDNRTCTLDSCDEVNDTCLNEPDDDVCTDTTFCDGVERCSPSSSGADTTTGCVDGTPPSCDDGVVCTDDVCDTNTDSCVNTNNDATCDDLIFCNGDELCQPLLAIADADGCVPGPRPTCADAFACTLDFCDITSDACVNAELDQLCNDGNFCNGIDQDGAEICDIDNVDADGRGCVDLDPVPCTDDGKLCTDEACNEQQNKCTATLDQSDCPASDQICTGGPGSDANGCEMGVSCNDSTDCDDGDPCNGNEFCNGDGICEPGVAPTCDDAVGCTDDYCDANDPLAGTDGCVHFVNDANCDDGDACNGAESCHPSLDCQNDVPLNCDDGIACTDDSCDSATGCVNVANNGNCSGTFCNPQFCSTVPGSLGCQPAGTRDCDDGIGCTVDSCNTNTQQCDNVPNDALCTNGQFCDGVEVCSDQTGCGPGTPPTCNDGIPCTDDSCNENTDSCEVSFNSGNCPSGEVCTAADCQPGATCTGLDHSACDALSTFCNPIVCSSTTATPGVCVAGTAPNCDDANACTIDSCSNTLGCQHQARDLDNDGFGDDACGGVDCDDSDPAINPLAVDDCDGIDNDCDGFVDGGLVAPGGTCSAGNECCSGICANDVCTLGGGQCGRTLDDCTQGFECCSGICDLYVDGALHCLAGGICPNPGPGNLDVGGACSADTDCCSGSCTDGGFCTRRGACGLTGDPCDAAADCCSLGCVNGFCSGDPADSCTEQAANCTDDAECCSNRCVGGTCDAPDVTSCKVAGEPCSSQGNCCSGLCFLDDQGNGRCAPHDSCRPMGEICTADRQCCTGTLLPGADESTVRGCDDVSGQCVFLGSCAPAGEPCTGVRNCCSALCVDKGSGVGVCEFLPGCRPYGEVCTDDYQCCSDEHDGNTTPSDPGGCGDPDSGADDLRRCVNPPGCVDAGEICAQGGSNNCCNLKSAGCTATGLGVSRCNDTMACIDIGEICEFSEQCCSGALCVPDSNGVPRCSNMCIPQGDFCLSNADCCDGVCQEGCVPDPSGCTAVGQGCTQNIECCSNFCNGGTCAQP